MSQPRYVKSFEELMQARSAEHELEFMHSDAQGVIIEYETDPELAAAIVPQPLVADPRGRIQVSFSKVDMQPQGGAVLSIGAALFAVHVTYEGKPGLYPVTMPMTSELAVVAGRETYGEPKKVCAINFDINNDTVAANVVRHDIPYMAFKGTLGKELAPREFVDHAYCFKFTPNVDGSGFDNDPLMIRLIWTKKQIKVREVSGELVLTESAFDPVADLPVRRLLGATWEQVETKSGGENVCSVPAMNLFPFVHQRYDELSAFFGK
jgi:acetoacetate decarboxylase